MKGFIHQTCPSSNMDLGHSMAFNDGGGRNTYHRCYWMTEGGRHIGILDDRGRDILRLLDDRGRDIYRTTALQREGYIEDYCVTDGGINRGLLDDRGRDI